MMKVTLRVIGVLLALAPALPVQAEQGLESAIVQAGKERFIDACAFCHGLAGTGNGMAASMLEKQPADLTLLSKQNRGEFPLQQIYRMIDGREQVRSHGSRDMPVWGERYREHQDPAIARARILELTLYLESIQAP